MSNKDPNKNKLNDIVLMTKGLNGIEVFSELVSATVYKWNDINKQIIDYNNLIKFIIRNYAPPNPLLFEPNEGIRNPISELNGNSNYNQKIICSIKNNKGIKSIVVYSDTNEDILNDLINRLQYLDKFEMWMTNSALNFSNDTGKEFDYYILDSTNLINIRFSQDRTNWLETNCNYNNMLINPEKLFEPLMNYLRNQHISR